MKFQCLFFVLPVMPHHPSRRDEVTLTRKIGYLRYFYSAAYFFSAILVVVAAIVPHALGKGVILRRIFTTASYCVVMRMTLTRQLPGSIQMWYDTLALVKKIEVGFSSSGRADGRRGESGPTCFLCSSAGVPAEGGVPSAGVQPDHHPSGAGQRVGVLGRGERGVLTSKNTTTNKQQISKTEPEKN